MSQQLHEPLYKVCEKDVRSRERSGLPRVNLSRGQGDRWRLRVDENRLFLRRDPAGAGPDSTDEIFFQDIVEVRYLEPKEASKTYSIKPENMDDAFTVLTDTKRYVFIVIMTSHKSEDQVPTASVWSEAFMSWLIKQREAGENHYDDADDNTDDDDDRVDSEYEEEEEEEEDDDLPGGSETSTDVSEDEQLPVEQAAPMKDLDSTALAQLSSTCREDEQYFQFASMAVKTSSKERPQERLLLVTHQRLYVVDPERKLRKRYKIVPLEQVPGILEEKDVRNKFAIVWPEGHDFLFSFPDDDGTKKKAFIEAVRREHQDATSARGFWVREVACIEDCLRRAVSAGPLPLERTEGDEFAVSQDENVFPQLYHNCDSTVHLSVHVTKIHDDTESQKMLVLTNLALYYMPIPLRGHVDRRIDLRDVEKVLWTGVERDGRKVLVKCAKQSVSRKYGDKVGDFVFKIGRGAGRRQERNIFVERLTEVLRKLKGRAADDVIGSEQISKERLESEISWERRDVMAVTWSGTRKVASCLTVFKKSARRRLKHVKEEVRVDHLALEGAKFTGGLVAGAAQWGYNGLTAGLHMGLTALTGESRGLSEYLQAAAKELQTPLDKFTGPRGNSVVLPIPKGSARHPARHPDPRDAERPFGVDGLWPGSELQKTLDVVGVPGDEKLRCKLECNVSNAMDMYPKVLVITTSYVLVFSRGLQQKSALHRSHYERKARLMDIHMLVKCTNSPPAIALVFEKKKYIDGDMILAFMDQLSTDMFVAHVARGAARLKSDMRREGEMGKQIQFCEVTDFDALKTIIRKGPEDEWPMVALGRGDGDVLGLSRTEALLKIFRSYGDKRVVFSSLVTIPGKRPSLLALTNTAVYLLFPSSQGWQAHRVELSMITKVTKNRAKEEEMIIRARNTSFSISLPGKTSTQVEPDHDVRISNLLNADVGMPHALEIITVNPRGVEGILTCIQESEAKSTLNKLKDALQRKKSSFQKAYGQPKEKHGEKAVTESIHDLPLVFRLPKECGVTPGDFIDALDHERFWWTCGSRPMPEGVVGGDKRRCALEVAREEPGDGDGFGLPLNPKISLDVAPPGDQARSDLQLWARRRLKHALSEQGQPALAFEVNRAKAVGLSSADVVFAKAVDTLQRTQQADRMRNDLLEAISRGSMESFNKTIKQAQDSALNDPQLQTFTDRSYRMSCLWSRPAGVEIQHDGAHPKAVESEGGKAIPIATGECYVWEAMRMCQLKQGMEHVTGFTFQGESGTTDKVTVTYVGEAPADAVPNSTTMSSPIPSPTPNSPGHSRWKQAVKKTKMAMVLPPKTGASPGVQEFKKRAIRRGGTYHVSGWTAVVKKPDELTLLQRKMTAALEQRRVLAAIRKSMQKLVSISAGPLDVQMLKEMASHARRIGCDPKKLGQFLSEISASVQVASVETLWAEKDVLKPQERRWLGVVWEDLVEIMEQQADTQADDEQITKDLQLWRKMAVPDCMVLRRLELAVRRSDRETAEQALEDLAGVIEDTAVLEKKRESTRDELRRITARDELRTQITSAISTFHYKLRPCAVRSLDSASLDWDELEQAINVLSKLGEKTKAFESLSDLTKQTAAFTDRLQVMRNRAHVRQEREREERKRSETAHRAYRELQRRAQERLDREKATQQRQHERLAGLKCSQALLILEAAEGYKRQVQAGNRSVVSLGEATQRLTEAKKELKDVQAIRVPEGSSTATIDTAVERLNEAIELWGWIKEQVSTSREVLLRRALWAEIDRIITAGDRQALVEFLREHSASGSSNPLRVEDLSQIRTKWRTHIDRTMERARKQAEILNNIRTAVRERDRWELERLLGEATEHCIAESHPTVQEAMGVRDDLVARIEQRMNDPGGDLSPLASPRAEGAFSEASGAEEEGGAGAVNVKSNDSDADFRDSDSEDATHNRTVTNVSGMVGVGRVMSPVSEVEAIPGAAVLRTLNEALRRLIGSSDIEPETKRVRCKEGNPNTKAYVDAWADLLRYRLKPMGGLFRKKQGEVINVFEEAQKHVYTVRESMRVFEMVRKLNHRRDANVNTFLLQYFMQSCRFYQCIVDGLLTMPEVLEKLYSDDSVFRSPDDAQLLLKTLKETQRLRFDFHLELHREDVEYLEGIDGQAVEVVAMSPTATEPNRTVLSGGGGGDVSSGDAPSPRPVLSPEERKAQEEAALAERRRIALDAQQFVVASPAFESADPVGKLRLAVRQLLDFYDASINKGDLESAEYADLFDDFKTKIVGLLVRERICPAIVALCNDGFRKKQKKHVWLFVEAVAKQCANNARDLGGTQLPGTVETVTAMARAGKGKKRRDEVEWELKVRTLFCEALNRKHLGCFIDTLYDTDPSRQDLLGDFYSSKSLMLDMEVRREVDAVLQLLSTLPFRVKPPT
eukprot:Hpha_TRINITY_DN16932_c1_g5::TRINITY_DN16932_c1_g5_i1::g.51587::m.51587